MIAGLTEQALLGWAGTRRLSALALYLKELRAKPLVPASRVLALFVAGIDQPTDAIEKLVGARTLQMLAADGVVEVGAEVHANVAILPLGQALIVCDRLDATDTVERVLPPDDSSYHLATALAATSPRHPQWIDLATGSAIAPLARPELAVEILGVDLNARAIRYAELGARLSNRTIETRVADVGAPLDRTAALVTCNAPIVDDPDETIWRRADRRFFDRLWANARACIAPGGDIVVHCTLDAMVEAELDGEVAIVVYTPPGMRAYGILWWQPDAPRRRALGYRALTAARPHLDPRDRTDLLAGALPPLDAAQV